jgi:hypothetical protein
MPSLAFGSRAFGIVLKPVLPVLIPGRFAIAVRRPDRATVTGCSLGRLTGVPRGFGPWPVSSFSPSWPTCASTSTATALSPLLSMAFLLRPRVMTHRRMPARAGVFPIATVARRPSLPAQPCCHLTPIPSLPSKTRCPHTTRSVCAPSPTALRSPSPESPVLATP